MSKLRITGIDHPGVAANDVEALADWYCDVFVSDLFTSYLYR